MDKLSIKGGATLSGSVRISGAKNAALPILAGTLLASEKVTVSNVPHLKDVTTMLSLLQMMGVQVTVDDQQGVEIDASNVDRRQAPYELVKTMRASVLVLGPLIARTGYARVSLPGGCAWGPRPVDLHIEGMKAFGAEIDLDEGYVIARATGGRLRGGRFTLTPSSVGATVNLLLAASTASGPSRIENAACEPDIIVFGEALQAMGAKSSGL